MRETIGTALVDESGRRAQGGVMPRVRVSVSGIVILQRSAWAETALAAPAILERTHTIAVLCTT